MVIEKEINLFSTRATRKLRVSECDRRVTKNGAVVCRTHSRVASLSLLSDPRLTAYSTLVSTYDPPKKIIINALSRAKINNYKKNREWFKIDKTLVLFLLFFILLYFYTRLYQVYLLSSTTPSLLLFYDMLFGTFCRNSTFCNVILDVFLYIRTSDNYFLQIITSNYYC
ncbi:hypothetical protein PUN28_016905 [Cardiocondyla obscurior]|uniref:Uncharacterized protein n=1 Tax=Cardiocondyla obscurior TaxID=286306 RepID=A0AAW2EQF4_9HYME